MIQLGHGDLHDAKFDGYMRRAAFEDIEEIGDGRTSVKLHYDKCVYFVRVYPSEHMMDLYKSNTPILVTMSVALKHAAPIKLWQVFSQRISVTKF